MNVVNEMMKIAEEYDKLIYRMHDLLDNASEKEISDALLELKAANMVADKDFSNINKVTVFQEDIAKLLKVTGPPETWAGDAALHIKVLFYGLDKIPKKYIYMKPEERLKKLEEAEMEKLRTSIAVSLINRFFGRGGGL